MTALTYKQFAWARTGFCLATAAFFLLFTGIAHAQVPHGTPLAANPAAPAASAVPADPAAQYTVEGVEVDVTAANAVKAREKALEEAQVKAWKTLAERLFGSPEQAAPVTGLDANAVSLLVQDFEVTNEQLSRVRYKGTYTIRFRPAAVRMQLSRTGGLPGQTAEQSPYGTQTPAGMAAPKPLLVLPFFQDYGRTTLWDATNPWMQVWRTMRPDRSLLQQTAVPLGDAIDRTKIGDTNATAYDPMKVQELASRYGADDVAVVLASLDRNQNPPNLVVSLYRHGFEGPVFVRRLDFARFRGETDAALLSRAAGQVKAMLRQEWKGQGGTPAQPQPSQPYTQTQTQPRMPVQQQQPYQSPYGGRPATQTPQPAVPYTQRAAIPATAYPAIVRFNNVQEWVGIKASIDRTQGIQSVLVKALKSREAALDIRYAGTAAQLQSALRASGITLRAGAGGTLELSRGGAAMPTQVPLPTYQRQNPTWQ